jgi:hypothetical protein
MGKLIKNDFKPLEIHNFLKAFVKSWGLRMDVVNDGEDQIFGSKLRSSPKESII